MLAGGAAAVLGYLASAPAPTPAWVAGHSCVIAPAMRCFVVHGERSWRLACAKVCALGQVGGQVQPNAPLDAQGVDLRRGQLGALQGQRTQPLDQHVAQRSQQLESKNRQLRSDNDLLKKSVHSTGQVNT